ncbi:hypothetical protein KP509_23G008100 [Ceratopteris richardii]|uniref:2Fe-2S ferredoxin-type domain-containing protein n=1 Tax=Ceratopteris richardii TaxID=49495 RepID=A0A8T2RX01_CERRI|nr:hypothetical protein KP509_23G008100 [Ceratopteris richardii]
MPPFGLANEAPTSCLIHIYACNRQVTVNAKVVARFCLLYTEEEGMAANLLLKSTSSKGGIAAPWDAGTGLTKGMLSAKSRVELPVTLKTERQQLQSHRKRFSVQAAIRRTSSRDGSAPHPFQPSPPQPNAVDAPLIEFEFVGPDNRPGETDPIPEPQYCTAVSGQKLLRDVMLENEVELYGPYGKMMNCEGRGMCGTCLVEILEGAELMNKRTPAEPYYLKLRPDSWRLACQATVGDGTNGGKIKVKRRPQKGNPLM